MSLLYCNYGRMSSVLTFYCVSISRNLHTRYGENFQRWYDWSERKCFFKL